MGRPLFLTYDGGECFLRQKETEPYLVTREDLKETLEYVSGYSLYAYEDDIPKKRGLPTSGRRNDQGMHDLLSCLDIWQHFFCTSLDLMCQTDIDAGNIFHPTDTVSVQDHLSGNSYTVPALYTQKTLADLIFISIQVLNPACPQYI